MDAKETPARSSALQYYHDNKRCRMTLYWDTPEEKQQLMALAQEQGYSSFSDWIRQMVHNAVAGTTTTTEYVASLKADLERYRTWVEQKDQQIEELRRALRDADQQKEDLRVVLATLAHQHPEAARALQPKGAR